MSQLSQKEEQKPVEIELRIASLKREIDNALVRFYSGTSRGKQDLWELRLHLAQISLGNCQAIAIYVKKISPPVAKELEARRRSVSRKLIAVERSHDLVRLNQWYKVELGPLLGKAEQAAYLVASTRKKASSDDGERFKWQLKEPPGGIQHVKLYGKTAEQFKYLAQTCPICGGRIDEMGWCGCGTIGGG